MAIPRIVFVVSILAVPSLVGGAESAVPGWTHLSSKKGNLPAPGQSNQQTSALTFDVDGDGSSEFSVGSDALP